MPQIEISTYPQQIFWFFLLFGVFFLVVNYIILPRLTSEVDGRDVFVSDNLSKAKALEVENDRLEVEIHEIQKQINNQSLEIMKVYQKKFDDFKATQEVEIQKIFDSEKLETMKRMEKLKSDILSDEEVVKKISALIVAKVTE